MKAFKFLALVLLFIGKCIGGNTNLDNILLIINYNHAHYESIPLLKSVYGDYFKNIVFYGPAQHQDVNYYPHHRGYFSYMCISEAMQKYPDFEGYLFLHDDCILNAWMLEDLDQSKIWCPIWQWVHSDRGDRIDITKGPRAYAEWAWWQTEWGWQPVTKAFNNLPGEFKKVLEQNLGPSKVISGNSDLVYIPACYKEHYIQLAPIFGEQRTFLELALPTIVNCLADAQDFIWLKVNSTYRRQTQDFTVDAYANHPIKLSSGENRDFVAKIFNNMKKNKE